MKKALLLSMLVGASGTSFAKDAGRGHRIDQELMAAPVIQRRPAPPAQVSDEEFRARAERAQRFINTDHSAPIHNPRSGVYRQALRGADTEQAPVQPYPYN